MKKFILSIGFLLFSSNAFAVGGFGLNIGQGVFSVDESSTPLLLDNPNGGDPLNVGSFTYHSFENSIGFGGYIYIDAIPFVDIDLEANVMFSTYEFSFNNEVDSIERVSFAWSSASTYGTLQKSIFKLKIPFLAKAKLTAGAGINQHSSTPMVSQQMLEEVITNGSLQDGQLDEQDLLNYLRDNQINSTGAHVQTGLQFKLLMLDSFVFYRHVFVNNVIPGKNNFGSINIRIGLGI